MKFIWLINMLVGAVIFWIVDLLFNYSPIVENTKFWIISKTITLPILLISTFLIINLKFKQNPLFTAFFMTLGIWISSPFYLYLWNVGLGNFSVKIKEVGMLILVFPISTISISTYSGCLGGLIITTITLFGTASFLWIKEK